MAQITSSVGLISGLNTAEIINDLLTYDDAPVSLLNTQVSAAQSQEQAYSTLSTQLSSMQTIGNTLALPQTFQNADAASSNTNVATATTVPGAAVGSYTLQVARLVSTQQSISTGYNSETAPLSPGTITLEEGGGEAYSQTPLSQLNGGAGVSAGSFRITDSSGNSAVINTSGDVNLDDVVNQINTAQNIDVQASITDNGLVINDLSGGSGALTIQDLSGGSTAQQLGIAGTATDGTITGSDINNVTTNTPLAQLNDGNGITTTSVGQDDFTATLANGSQVSVSLAGSLTLGDVINKINTAGAGKLVASINAAGNGIKLTDTTSGGGSLTITADNGSPAAQQLGLTGTASGGVLNGAPLVAGLDSVLVSSLRGQNGTGITLGSISVTNMAGATGTINLSGATSVSDILSDINNAGLDLNATLNASGTGIAITDKSGGTGTLSISDSGGGSTAEQLGIAVSGSTTGVVNGINLQRQYISANTLLSTYAGGAGVGTGEFQITNSKGESTTIDLGTGTFNTVGDVINAINAKNIGVTASINSTGNGIELTDTAGGANAMTVTDLDNGTTAAALNIAGTASGTGAQNTINGALQKTITVTSSDTLTTLQNQINQLGFGVTANIVNDGDTSNPYRLSLTAINSGSAGRVVVDSGTTGLDFTNLVNGQDAAVFYGGGDGVSQPLLITSNTNQLTNVIKGVTINLTGASTSPVTINVTPDPSNVETQLQNFVTDFNTLVNAIDADSTYNTTTNQGGVLLGDATTERVQSTIYSLINSVVTGAGQYQDLADIGITINSDGSTSGATLQFDQNTFEAAFAADPTAVQNLFSQTTTGLGTQIANAMNTLIDPVDGAITVENNTLNTQITQYQNQITQLNQIIAEQREQLENEFNNMETTLASLESQQSIIASLAGEKVSAPAASSSTGSSNSSSSSTSSSSTS